MEKPDPKFTGKDAGKGWTRRSFAASLVSAVGLALARLLKGQKAAASPVSAKEASYYVSLD